MSASATFSEQQLGFFGFSFSAVTPKGRTLNVTVVHSPTNGLTPESGILLNIDPSFGSCFLAYVVDTVDGSSLLIYYTDSADIIEFFNTL